MPSTLSGEDSNSEFLNSGDLTATVLEEIRTVLSRVDMAGVDALASALLSTNRTFVTGEGRSGLMAKAFAMRLMHLGLPVFVVGETTTPAVAPGDLLVAVSGSGTTAATVRAAQAAVSIGASAWGVTTDAQSLLARMVGQLLVIPAATKDRKPGETATIQPLSSLFDQTSHILFDVVCLVVAQSTGQDNTSAAARHANTE